MNNMMKRVLSLLLSAVLLLGNVPVTALAQEETAPAAVEETVAATAAPTQAPTEPAAETAAPAEAQTEPVQTTVPAETAAPTEAVTEPSVTETEPPKEKPVFEGSIFFDVPSTLALNGTYFEELQPASGYPESDHNYANSTDVSYSYQVANASYLKLTFSADTLVENNYDYIYIYNGSGVLQSKYTGSTLAGKTVTVEGSSIRIRLTSDSTQVKYGFSIDSIYAGYELDETTAQIATLPKTGYKIGDTVDLTGLTITAKDSTDTLRTIGVADGITLVSADTATKGKKTVTVAYGTLSLQFQIGVHNAIAGETLMDKSGYPESKHNYSKNTDQTWTYFVAGADSLKLKFSSKTETESGCDYIYIYDGAGTELGKYSGTQLSGQTITVTGNTFKIRLDSDSDENEYGFAFDSIYATNIAEHEMDGGVYTPHTCTKNAYTTYSCTICDYTKVETHANTAAHTWNEGVYTDPTCVKDGYTTYSCLYCTTTKTETDTGSALGHAPDEGVYTEPDCYADGYTTFTCTRCGNQTTETDADTAFHAFDGGKCTVCGVSDDVIDGGWLSGKNTYWAMLPGNVLYLGGNGEASSNYKDRSRMTSATSVIIGEGITVLGSALYGLSKITSVDIPANVTAIGANAFTGCTGLKSLYIPATVTRISGSSYSDSPFYNNSTVKVYCEAKSKPSGWGYYWNYYNSNYSVTASFGATRGDFAYWNTLDTSAATIVIPDGVTMIPDDAFYNRTTLKWIYIPSSVTTIGYDAFWGCSSGLKVFCENTSSKWQSNWNRYASSSYLTVNYGTSVEEFNYWNTLSTSATSVEIPDYVTTIPAYAFSSCSNLKSVTIPDSVTKIMANAFYNRDSLTTVQLGEGVTSIGATAFNDCDGLTAVYIPASVTSISASSTSTGPFYGCNSTLKIFCGASAKGSGWGNYWNYYAPGSTVGTGYSLTVVYDVPASEFGFWSTLDTAKETIEIPDGITAIPSYTFQGMSGVKKVIIPDSVTTISAYAFSGCSGLTEIEIPGSVTTIGNHAFNNCSTLTEIVIPEGVQTIGEYAFSGCTGLVKVTFPTTLTLCDYNAFYNCTAVTEVHIPSIAEWCEIDFDYTYSNPLYYGELYVGGVKTTDIVIPDGVTSIGNRAFYYSNITSVTIPASVKNIGYTAFDGCSSLTAVHISDLSAWCGITFKDISANPLRYGTMYLNGEAITDLVIPADVTSIAAYSLRSPKLTSVTIHSGVTSIGSDAFNGCSALEKVCIEDLAAWCAVEFGDDSANPLYYGDLYVNGEMVTDLVIPDSVTKISKYAFVNYDALKTVTVPASVKEIAYGAFYDCDGMTTVTVAEGLERVGDYAFYSCGALTTAEFPDSVGYLGQNMFSHCTALTSFRVPANVKSIPYNAFYYCSALEELTLQEGLASINSSAFYYCNKLNTLYIPATVVNIYSYAFRACTSVTEIYFAGNAPSIASDSFVSVNANAYYPYNAEGWDDSKLVHYGGTLTWSTYSPAGVVAQGTCGDNLRWSLDEEGGLIISGTGDMYEYAISGGKTSAPWKNYTSSIAQVTVDKGVTHIGKYAFYGCSKLTKLDFRGDLPTFSTYALSNIKATATYNASNATWNPNNLGNYGGTITWKPVGMSEEYIAHSNLNLTSGYWKLDYDGTLTLENWTADYSYNNAPWYPYRNHIKKVIFGGKSASRIGKYAFSGLSELTEVVVTASWMYTVADRAFYSCPKLKYVDLGDEVESIGTYAFYNCTALESIYLPPDNNTSIGERAFSYCTALKEISLPCEVTLATEVFFGSTNLKTIYINQHNYGNGFSPAADSFETVTANVYWPRDSWGEYGGTPSGSYGGTLTWIEADYGTCGPDARWSYDPVTKKLTISGTGRIASSPFAGWGHPWGGFNDEILSIEVQQGITKIPSYTFEYCEAATTVILPEGITIDLNAFNDCGSLNNLILPHDLTFGTDYHNTEFIRCESLTDVYYFGTKAQWDEILYSSTVSSFSSNMTLHFLELIPSTATCTASGVQEYYQYDKTTVYDTKYDANRNPITQLSTVPALGHDEVIDAAVPATCTETGLTEGKHCDRCGEVLVAQTTASVLGHDMSDWVVVTPSTCTEDGLQRKDCSRCGHYEEEVIPAGHDYVDGICSVCQDVQIQGSGSCGENVTWELDVFGNLTVSGTGAVSGTDEWKNNPDIKTVVIEGGVTDIGESAFAGCENLESVTIPDSVKTIGECAFQGCTNLESITIGSSVTVIGPAAFDSCESLTHVVIPDGVRAIGDNAFLNCSGLTSVVIPAGVTEIGTDAFGGCDSLTDVYYGGTAEQWKALGENVPAAERIHYSCTNPETHWTTETVAPDCENAGYTHEVCSCGYERNKETTDAALGHDMGDWVVLTPAACEETGLQRKDCSRCDHFEEEIIPETGHSHDAVVVPPTCIAAGYTTHTCHCGDIYMDTPVAALGHDMGDWVIVTPATCETDGLQRKDCSRCDHFEEEVIPAGHKVENGICTGCMAYGTCGENLTWTLANGVLTISGKGAMVDFGDANVQNVPWNPVAKQVQKLVVEEGITTIGSWSFVQCTNISELSLPTTLKTIGAHAFYDNQALTTVELPDGLTSIGANAFAFCRNLKEIDIPASVKTLEINAFSLCNSLEKVTVGGEGTIIGEDAFAYDYSLTDVTIRSGVVAIKSEAFLCCDKLEGIVIPASVKTIEAYAFAYATSLKSVYFEGNAPTFKGSGIFDDVETTVYYPTGDESWTKDIMQDYGGTVSWKPHCYNGHSYVSTVTEPTCTAKGYTRHTCPCGDSFVDTYVDALGHSEGEWVETKAPTCTQTGTQTKSCTRCGEVMKKEEIPAAGHSHEAVVTPPTCTEDGYTTHTCHCGDTYTDSVVPMLGHDMSHWVIVSPATCTEDGLQRKDCSRCDHFEEEAIPQTGHSHEAVVTAPTCTADGFTTHTCHCGDTYTDSVVPMLGHDMSDWVIVTPATCTVDGLQRKDCSRCDHFEEEVIPATGHSFEQLDDKIICSACGEELKLSIAQDYVLLEAGQTLTLGIAPAELAEKIEWTIEGDEGAVTTNANVLTAVSEGTVYVTATLKAGEFEVSVRFRVDVSAKENIAGIQLSAQKLTAELYSTKYAGLDILLQLPQNYGLMAEGIDVEAEHKGIAIEKAVFTDAATAEMFDILVLDDRSVQIIPADHAVKNPKLVKGTYKSAITVTVLGEEHTSEILTLTVKKTLPKVKATVTAFNSFYPDQSRKITFTGATVEKVEVNEAKATAKTPAMPNWLTITEDGTLTMIKDAPAKSLSGKAQLLVYTSEWRIPAAITLTVKNTYKVPAIKLAAASVTVKKQDANSIQLQLACSAKTDKLENLMLKSITAPAGYGIENFNTTDGTFTLTAENGFKAGKIVLTVAYGTVTKNLTLTVKLEEVKLKLASTKVSLNKDLKESASVALSCITKGYELTDPVLTYDSTKLDVRFENGNLIVSLKDDAAYGKTYPVTVSAYSGAPTVKLNVAVLKKTAAVKSTIKATGSLDVIRESTSITVKPTYTNVRTVDVDRNAVLKIYSSADKYKEAIAELKAENGIFVIDHSVISNHTLKYKAQLETKIYEDKDPVKSNLIPLTVKMGTAKVTAKADNATMFAKDVNDRVVVTFTAADVKLNGIEKVEIKTAAQAAMFELIDNGDGTYSIAFKDGVIPASIAKQLKKKASYAVTLTLNIFIEGNLTAKANTTASVKLTIKK